MTSYQPPAPVPGDPPPSSPRSVPSSNSDQAIAYVYVPTRPYEPVPDGGPQPVQFELRLLTDGSAGLAVFTTEEYLDAQLGEHQPRVRIAVLDLLVQLSNEKVPVVVDPRLQQGSPRWTAADTEKWHKRQE